MLKMRKLKFRGKKNETLSLYLTFLAQEISRENNNKKGSKYNNKNTR